MSKIKLKSAYYNDIPSGVELLVRSPEGFIDIANYRECHKIFTCQSKGDSLDGWYFTELDLELEYEQK